MPPPLKVSSGIVANDPRMVPGYSNLGDYLPDDVHYEIMEVDEHKYHYGKPLVKDERSLTTMMRRLHDWYMKTCRESYGTSTLTLRVKPEHDLVGIELLNVPFEDFLLLSVSSTTSVIKSLYIGQLFHCMYLYLSSLYYAD